MITNPLFLSHSFNSIHLIHNDTSTCAGMKIVIVLTYSIPKMFTIYCSNDVPTDKDKGLANKSWYILNAGGHGWTKYLANLPAFTHEKLENKLVKNSWEWSLKSSLEYLYFQRFSGIFLKNNSSTVFLK